MKSKQEKLFPFLCMIFAVLAILSNISASNTFYINDFLSLSAAELLFPIIYIINDLLVEFYGRKTAIKVVAFGLSLMLFSSVFLFLTTLIPSNYIEYNVVFGNITSGVIGITFASILAFLAGSCVNALIMDKMKKRDTTGKTSKFFKRTMLSSVAAEVCDSLLFITLCCLFAPEFYAWDRLLSFVLTISAIKLMVEFLMFPVLNALRKAINKPPKQQQTPEN